MTDLASCTQLADAFFTVRVHYASEVRMLGDARRDVRPSTPAVYRFDLLPPLTPQASGAFRVEARLDMAYFPGGREGMPCDGEECVYADLVEQGSDWSGERIWDQLRVDKEYMIGRFTASELPRGAGRWLQADTVLLGQMGRRRRCRVTSGRRLARRCRT